MNKRKKKKTDNNRYAYFNYLTANLMFLKATKDFYFQICYVILYIIVQMLKTTPLKLSKHYLKAHKTFLKNVKVKYSNLLNNCSYLSGGILKFRLPI